MSEKKYKDIHGTPRTLRYMMARESEWVLARFQSMERQLAQRYERITELEGWHKLANDLQDARVLDMKRWLAAQERIAEIEADFEEAADEVQRVLKEKIELYERVQGLEGVVEKLRDAWKQAADYMPVDDGSPSYRAAKRVLDAFEAAAAAAQADAKETPHD